MAAAFHCYGAIEHYVRPIGNAQWLYLGTAVQSPEIEEEEMLLPVMNDIGGRSVPVDYVMDRKRAIVTTTLNRFNYTTYNILRGMRPPGQAGAVFATDTILDHGIPSVAGGYAFQLMLANTFGGGFSAPDSPAGRMYYAAILRKHRETSLNSRVNELTLLFECIGQLNASDRSFRLYTEDPTAWGQLTVE